jgi:Hexapeptide repeat of succinyl-transferase
MRLASVCKLEGLHVRWASVEARLLRRDTRLVRYQKARVRLLGQLDGGGRIDVSKCWPQDYPARTELLVGGDGRLTVEQRLTLYGGCKVIVAPGAHLRIRSALMNNGAVIACASETSIGCDVNIGPGAYLRDTDSHGISGSPGPAAQPITIGDHVWIGMRAIILKGVTIGDGAVVAAGAVVTKDVEPGTLVAGVPARFVRSVTWDHAPDFAEAGIQIVS